MGIEDGAQLLTQNVENVMSFVSRVPRQPDVEAGLVGRLSLHDLVEDERKIGRWGRRGVCTLQTPTRNDFV